MREFCISIGGHLTTGGLNLYSLRYRIYPRVEAAVAVDAASGKCLLRKHSSFEFAAVPDLPPLRSLLSTYTKSGSGCVPFTFDAESAGITAFGRLDAGIVPDAEMSGRLTGSASGEGEVAVVIDPARTNILSALGGVHNGIVATVSDSMAMLHEAARAGSVLHPGLALEVSSRKSGAGESAAVISASAHGRVVRYRKLYEVDPMDLGSMDNMTLYDLDLICTE